MDETYKIAMVYINNGHELGKSFSQEEAFHLVNSLRNRLVSSNNELDLSPESLEYLADILQVYYKKKNFLQNNDKHDDLMQLIREIASYIGLVLVIHSGGEWNQKNTLDSLEIKFTKTRKASKNKPELKKEFFLDLFYPAYRTITGLEMGVRPNLFFIYKNANPSRQKEILG